MSGFIASGALNEGPDELFCFRCKSIGVPAPSIGVGDKFVVMQTEDTTDTACKDCFDRLNEEIKEIE